MNDKQNQQYCSYYDRKTPSIREAKKWKIQHYLIWLQAFMLHSHTLSYSGILIRSSVCISTSVLCNICISIRFRHLFSMKDMRLLHRERGVEGGSGENKKRMLSENRTDHFMLGTLEWPISTKVWMQTKQINKQNHPNTKEMKAYSTRTQLKQLKTARTPPSIFDECNLKEHSCFRFITP